MNLINFLEDVSLNNLRQKMGANLKKWEGKSEWSSFDPFGFREALRENGEVDIPFDEIKISSNKTLELYGEKILVYIRDQRFSHDIEYKFHIANCVTLKDAQKNKKYEKYVASVNTNGIFKVNLVHGNSWVDKDQDVELNVCRNCLTALNYKGYRDNKFRKNEVYSNFELKDFFDLYKKQNVRKPKYTNVTAPLNNYTKDFTKIANELKVEKKYLCESCNRTFVSDKKFLHVHHIDSIKSNNRLDNLKVVCIGCHAEEPGHSHIKNLPDYREYQNKFYNRLF